MVSIMQIVEDQSEVIRKQSEIIDELFHLLLQHIEVEEICSLSTYADMQNVAGEIKKYE